jgi:hypothetical protein
LPAAGVGLTMLRMPGATVSTSIIALLTALVVPGSAEPAGSAVVVATARATYNAAFAWSTTTTWYPDGSKDVVHADGFPFARNLVPLVPVRQGERIRFRASHPVDDIAVRYGRRRPISLGSAPNVSWRVPAGGTYVVAITVASTSPSVSTTAEYVVRLRARRPSQGRARERGGVRRTTATTRRSTRMIIGAADVGKRA